MKWAEDAKITVLKGSYVWLNGALKRYGLKRINIHGDADDLMDEGIARVMVPWRAEL